MQMKPRRKLLFSCKQINLNNPGICSNQRFLDFSIISFPSLINIQSEKKNKKIWKIEKRNENWKTNEKAKINTDNWKTENWRITKGLKMWK